jgi:hypothetical protein
MDRYDIKPNNYYTITAPKVDYIWIFKDNGGCSGQGVGGICTYKSGVEQYYSDSVNFGKAFDNWYGKEIINDATPEEIAWLDLCIANNKYIDKPVLDKETLLKEAKERYPKNSIIKFLDGRTFKCSGNFFGYSGGQLYVNGNSSNFRDIVYKDGVWAAIVEQEFVFPEYWYIVVTKENKDVLCRWRGNVNLKPGHITGWYKGLIEGGSKEHNYSITDDDGWGEEITFEQFKEHVLKKPIFEVGDTVEVLDTEDVRRWGNGHEAIGKTLILDSVAVECLNKGYETSIDDNKYSVSYKPSDLKIVKKNKVKQLKTSKNECKQDNKEDSSNLQRVNQSIRRTSSSRRARLAGSKEQVKLRGAISGNKKRPSFSNSRAF